jgi:hypothetical protein
MSILQDPGKRAVAESLLGSDGVQRMDRIAREMLNASRGPRATSPMVSDIIGSEATLASALIDRAARVGGARLGAVLGRGGGAGSSLQAAQMGSSTLQKIVGRLASDNAETLLTRSILDDELFTLLFTPVTQQTAPAIESRLLRYLNQTVLGIEDMLNTSLPGTAAAVTGAGERE